MEIIFFSAQLVDTERGYWLEGRASAALEKYSKDGWEVKAAVPVTKNGETVAINYTLQCQRGGLVPC